jgi:hypothetical protein
MARGPLAGAAGPGKFSVRTDGLSLPSAAYGEGVETQAIKQASPLANTPDVRGATNTQVRQAASQKAEKMAGLFDKINYTAFQCNPKTISLCRCNKKPYLNY